MVPDDPLWWEMEATGRLGSLPVTILAETTSTNEVAFKLAHAGGGSGSIILAEAQSMGRGRLGKKWLSPPGTGLYFSMILRPELEPADLPKITMAAGLAACKAVWNITGLAPTIKWPNDLLLDGKKFAGILTETEAITMDEQPIVILGIGMNVNTPSDQFPPDLQEKATSISSVCGREISRGKLLKEITDQVITMVSRLEKEGFSQIRAEWQLFDATINRELTWVTQSGKVVCGVSLGPDKDGLLRIRDRQGQLHEVLSGDIELGDR